MVEASHNPGNVNCSEVRDLLSDLIDVRREELPHPDGTRLSEPGLRAAVELHLAGCEDCRTELWMLEETGAAFAEFSVGELPVQQFADWGPQVRAKIKRAERAPVLFEKKKAPSRVRQSLIFVGSSLAAASLAFVVASGSYKNLLPANPDKPSKVIATRDRTEKALAPILRKDLKSPTPITVVVPGVQPVTRVFTHDPQAPETLRSLQVDESKHGYLVLGERTVGNDQPLLGVYLRTTRDVDRETLGLMVYHVVPGSPADMMGLKPNDYIVTVNGAPVSNGGADEAVNFISGIREAGAGAEIDLHILRPISGEHLFMTKQGRLGEYRYETKPVE